MNTVAKIAAGLVALPSFFHTMAQNPALAPRAAETRFSNNGKIKIEFNRTEKPEMQVWLSGTDQPARRTPLGDKFFYVQDIDISPENKWIVVKDGTGSAGTSLILFRRSEGLHYKEAGRVKPDAALKVLIALKKIPQNFMPAHLHCTLIGWLDEDAGSIVVNISADGGSRGGQTHSLNWLALYDPATAKMSSPNQEILKTIKKHQAQ